MDVDRRFILNGVMLTSFVGFTINDSLLSFVHAAFGAGPRPARPILALVSGSARQSSFLQGVAMTPQGANAEILCADLSTGFVRDLNLHLRSEQPKRIVGLVDDACAAWIIQIARSAGASAPWLGQHSTSPGQARHHIMSTGFSDIGAVEAARQPHTPRAMFGPPGEGALSGSEQWPAVLGLLLASSGCQDNTVPSLASTMRTPLYGTFASLLIES